MIIDYPECPTCGSTGHVLTESGWRPCPACSAARREAERAVWAALAPETDVVDGLDGCGNDDDDTCGDFADLV